MLMGVPYDAEVEYLESTGTQWIDTEIYSDYTLTYQMSFRPQGDVFRLGGARVGENPSFMFSLSNSAGLINDYGSGASKNRLILSSYKISNNLRLQTLEFGNRYIRDVDTNTILISESVVSQTSAGLPPHSLLMLAVWSNGEVLTGTEGKVYGCKVWKGSTLVCDFIPVRVGTTGFMYDRVSKRLFGNDGTGDFTVGPDVAKPVMSLRVHKLLPYDAEIEYLQSDGYQWIDTGINPSSTMGLELKFTYVSNVDASPTTWSPFFGADIGWESGTGFGLHGTAQTVKFGFKSGHYPFEVGGTYDLSMHDGVCVINGSAVTFDYPDYYDYGEEGGFSDESFVTDATMYMFANHRPDEEMQTSISRFYYCRIYDGSTLVRDFIPVRIAARGFMYDRVTGGLFGNIGDLGGGDLALGPDVALVPSIGRP